jgi:hypothetical protein
MITKIAKIGTGKIGRGADRYSYSAAQCNAVSRSLTSCQAFRVATMTVEICVIGQALSPTGSQQRAVVDPRVAGSTPSPQRSWGMPDGLIVR